MSETSEWNNVQSVRCSGECSHCTDSIFEAPWLMPVSMAQGSLASRVFLGSGCGRVGKIRDHTHFREIRDLGCGTSIYAFPDH